MSGSANDEVGWEGASYATQSGHHRSFDDWFLDQHRPMPGDTIIDAGCGSGEFTARLAALATDGHVIGVEPDASMLEAAARHAATNLEFRQGSVQELDGVCAPSSADLVVSRAVFHWIPLSDYPRCFRAVHGVLKPGGWFHAESGGAGNVSAFRGVLGAVARELGLSQKEMSFPDAGVALDLLEHAGFTATSSASTVAQRRAFDREGLLGMIRTQASVAWGVGSDAGRLDEFVAAAADRIEELRRHDGSFDQTFVRLHILAQRRA